MRISTNQIYNQSIRSIMDNQKGLTDTQEALATGKKLNRPSDDPVGAAKVIRLTEHLDKLTQYQRNNDLLTNSLEQQDAVLDNINNALTRARTLVVRVGSGVLNESDKKTVGTELEQIRDEVLDLMNAQDANGNYLFAGNQSQQQAFEFNPAASGNAVTFVGDAGNNSVKLSDSVSVRSATSGQEVFENVPARRNFTVASSPLVDSASVTQQGTFDTFYKNNYDAVNAANNDYQLEVLAGGNQVQLTQVSTGNVVGTVDYATGEPFSIKGMEFTLTGSAGDTVNFSLDTAAKKNVAETLNDMAAFLKSGAASGDALQESINDALVGLDNGMEKLSLERSSIGGRINTATSIYETNLDLEIAAKDSRSSIQDTDYAEASAEFARQETALNAALQTFPKVSNLSLFNYI